MIAAVVILGLLAGVWIVIPLLAGRTVRPAQPSAAGKKHWANVERQLLESRLEHLQIERATERIDQPAYQHQWRLLEQRLAGLARLDVTAASDLDEVLEQQIRAVRDAIEAGKRSSRTVES